MSCLHCRRSGWIGTEPAVGLGPTIPSSASQASSRHVIAYSCGPDEDPPRLRLRKPTGARRRVERTRHRRSWNHRPLIVKLVMGSRSVSTGSSRVSCSGRREQTRAETSAQRAVTTFSSRTSSLGEFK